MGGPGSGRVAEISPLMLEVKEARLNGNTFTDIGNKLGYTRQYAHYLWKRWVALDGSGQALRERRKFAAKLRARRN